MAPKTNSGKQVVKSAQPAKKTTKGAPKVEAKKATKVVKVTKRKAYTRPQFRRPTPSASPPPPSPETTPRSTRTLWTTSASSATPSTPTRP